MAIFTAICLICITIILGSLYLIVKFLVQNIVGSGVIFALFMFVGFAIIEAVGGVVYFVVEKVLEWFKSRKG